MAWVLSGKVCGNDGERYGGSLFSWAKPTLRISVVPRGEFQAGLIVVALSLALSRGERDQITEVRPLL